MNNHTLCWSSTQAFNSEQPHTTSLIQWPPHLLHDSKVSAASVWSFKYCHTTKRYRQFPWRGSPSLASPVSHHQLLTTKEASATHSYFKDNQNKELWRLSLSLTSNRMTWLTPQHKTQLSTEWLACVGLHASTHPSNGNTQLKHYTRNTQYLSGDLRSNS